MPKRERKDLRLGRRLVIALVGSALVGGLVFWIADWRLEGRATKLTAMTAQEATAPVREADRVELARALRRAQITAGNLESARIVTPDGEVVADLGERSARARGIAPLRISMTIPVPGQTAAMSLEMAYSRARLLGMALFTALCSAVVLGMGSLLLGTGADRRRGKPIGSPSNTENIPEAPSSNERPLAGMRVLIADDSEISRRLLGLYVKRHGGQIDEAIDGQQAIELAEGLDYACIVLDLRMPRVDGATAAQRLKDRDPRTPVIAVTAQSDTEFRLAHESGFDACLIKPVAEEDLIAALRQLTSRGASGSQAPGDSPSQPTPGPVQDRPDIHDPHRALEVAGGIESLAAELYTMLTKELAEQLPVLTDPATTTESLREIAHKLRASARYCAAPTLELRATTLEEALVSKASQAEIQSARQHLCRAIQDLLTASESTGSD